jgi:hypothetical protein
LADLVVVPAVWHEVNRYTIGDVTYIYETNGFAVRYRWRREEIVRVAEASLVATAAIKNSDRESRSRSRRCH